MAYNPTVYVNDEPPALNADNLNKAEQELVFLDNQATNIIKDVNGLTDTVGQIGDVVSDAVDLGISPSTGFYTANGGGYNSSSNYRYILTACNPGDVFIVNSTYGANAHVALFYNGVPASNTFVGLYGEKTNVESYAVNMQIPIPEGVSYVVFDSKKDVTFNVAKKVYYDAAKEDDLEDVKNALLQYISPEVSFITGKCYNVNNKTATDVTNGEYFNYSLPSKGLFEKVKFTGHMFSSSKYAILSFWDVNGNLISTFGVGSTTYTDEVVDIPAGTKSIIMNTNSTYDVNFELYAILPGNSAEAEEAGDIFYQLSNDQLYVSTRFNATTDFVVLIRKKGGNTLPDFGYFYSNSNTAKKPKANLTGIQKVFSQGSDWHGPMIVRTVNNQDGDNKNSHYWTGGNHQYNNTGINSTPTARCTDLKFYVDNAQITEGSGYCNSVRIVWTNMIQSYSTTKADGSGREVLQENHQLYFDGHKWETCTEIIALEDVVFERYYGLQFGGCGTWFDTVRYPGATNRLSYDADDVSQCGDKISCRTEAFGQVYELDLELDTLYDLGKREQYTGTKGMFVSAYGKSYTYVIGDDNDEDGRTNYPVNEGEMITLRGCYEFKPSRYTA